MPAIRAAESTGRLVRITIVQSVPWTIGLLASIRFAGTGVPTWLLIWLWVTYGILFVGEIRVWWLPYSIRPEPDRAARYRSVFAAARAFPPVRHGTVPNTLHCMLHACTAFTLLVHAAC